MRICQVKNINFFANNIELSQLLIWAILLRVTKAWVSPPDQLLGVFPLFAVSGTIPLMRLKILIPLFCAFLASCDGGNTSEIPTESKKSQQEINRTLIPLPNREAIVILV